MQTQATRPYVVAAGEGEGIWFLNTLFTVKAGADQTEGNFTFMEQTCPAGFAPPRHVHFAETEAFYMLDGRVTVCCGDIERVLLPGDFVLLPRGIPHGFQVSEDGPARFIHLTSPGQFDHFAREIGEPAKELTLPEPGDIDLPKFLRTLPEYELEVFSE
ncbi:MAG: cupin domain-containing protein [Actinobacteria bacterium]|nr:MAG: cupin domain-containing protein [Actinomycetota bacterium]